MKPGDFDWKKDKQDLKAKVSKSNTTADPSRTTTFSLYTSTEAVKCNVGVMLKLLQ